MRSLLGVATDAVDVNPPSMATCIGHVLSCERTREVSTEFMLDNSPISKVSVSDATGINHRYPQWNHVIPLPPEGLMWSVGGQSVENFLVVGDAWAQLIARYTSPDCTVLDMGCGCGRTARLLTTNGFVRRYIGFDVIPENVAWCQKFIRVAAPREFTFRHFDLFSAAYNPAGQVGVRDFRFPSEGRSVHLAFAASLFTHLLEPDARHYLREIARVLTPAGRALVSIHVNTPEGQVWYGTEHRIDIDPNVFVAAAKEAGLRMTERIGEVGGQELFVFGLPD